MHFRIGTLSQSLMSYSLVDKKHVRVVNLPDVYWLLGFFPAFDDEDGYVDVGVIQKLF